MKALLIALLLYTMQANAQCLKMDIILLVDVSGSVEEDAPYIQQAIAQFVEKLQPTQEGIRISIILFSSKAFLINNLNQQPEKIEIATYIGGGTNMFGGITEAHSELLENGRFGVNNLIIVISDGDVDKVTETKEVIDGIKKMGVNICSIMIDNGAKQPIFMNYICTDNCFVSSSYEMLIDQLQKLNICL